MTKIRDFLDDLWFDLRERRLLPLVGLLAVALVAVPFVLGGSSSEPAPPVAATPDVIETQPAVAQSVESGVRTGKSRLKGQKAKNPFRQQLTSLPKSAGIDETATPSAATAPTGQQSAASQLSQQLSSASSAVSSGSSAGSGGSSSGSSSSGSSSTSSATEPTTKTTTTTKVKTKIEKVVKLERRKLRVRFGKLGKRNRIKGLVSLDQLPRKGDPVLVLLGIDRKGHATFSVSKHVKSVWGEGKCTPHRHSCEYLTIKPGHWAKFRYQPVAKNAASAPPDPIVYSLTVVRISTQRVNAG